jgi:hypothetical protein
MPSDHPPPSRFAPPQTDSHPGRKPTFRGHLRTIWIYPSMPSHRPSHPCFRIVRRCGRGVLGDKRWVFFL